MPSALMSCILQQADTIRMANLSTTNMRHSTLPAPGLPLKRITSFMISARKKNGMAQRINDETPHMS